MERAAMTMLSLQAVTRSYKAPKAKRRKRDAPTKRVGISAVTLNANPGELIALLGPNGSGKSTLLRLAATLDNPGAGKLRIFDQDPQTAALTGIRRRLGVVFQTPCLDPLLTVRENLTLHASLYERVESATEQRMLTLADQLGITDRLNERVATLSGGLARRADLARALMTQPKLLLLDEPEAGLDADSREAFTRVIQDYINDHDACALLATHHLDTAERASRVVMLHEGVVVADAPPADLRDKLGPARLRIDPAHQDAALAAAPSLTLTPSAGELILESDPATLADFAASLTRAKVPFRIGPPTLFDVYTHLVGQPINWSRESP